MKLVLTLIFTAGSLVAALAPIIAFFILPATRNEPGILVVATLLGIGSGMLFGLLVMAVSGGFFRLIFEAEDTRGILSAIAQDVHAMRVAQDQERRNRTRGKSPAPTGLNDARTGDADAWRGQIDWLPQRPPRSDSQRPSPNQASIDNWERERQAQIARRSPPIQGQDKGE